MMPRIAEETRVSAAVWDSARDEARRAELSHWRGAGKWRDENRWRNIGVRSRRRIERLAQTAGLEIWSEPRAMLEWGPGGGANLAAFVDVAKSYYGVDISRRNLDEAARMIGLEGYEGFRPVLISEKPEEALAEIREPIDVFLSTAVFQHFPSRAYGVEVLKVISAVCSPAAIGVIQIRYAEESGEAGETPLADYERRFITANSFGIEEFRSECENAGLEVVSIEPVNPTSRYATYNLRKR
jgi:hypothetical protein